MVRGEPLSHHRPLPLPLRGAGTQAKAGNRALWSRGQPSIMTRSHENIWSPLRPAESTLLCTLHDNYQVGTTTFPPS